jgi:exopolysaccharide biosynthesis polyprenyl glycosylphosphotransferase
MHSSIGFGKPEPEWMPQHPAALALTHPALPNPAGNFRRLFAALEVGADFVTVIFAVTFGYLVYYQFDLGKHIHYSGKAVLGVAFGLAIIIVLMLDRVGAYARGNSLLRVRETEQIVRVSTQAFVVALAVSFFASFLFSRWLLVLALGLVPLFLFVQKLFMYLLVQRLHSKGYGIEKVLIYGSGHTGRRVLSVLRRSPKLGLEPLAFVDDVPAKIGIKVFEMGYEKRRSAPVVEGPVTKELVAQYGADLVIIAIPSLAHEKFVRTVQEVMAANVRVSFVPTHSLATNSWVGYEDIDGVFLASFNKISRWAGYELTKRICDLLLSVVLLVLGAPLFLLLAALIKIDSSGPVFFRQIRVGKNGRQFKMWKFRTMRDECPVYGYSPNVSSDPRITRMGRFLRRTSLDELPQLFNVVEGNMSLVGPRPEMPFIVEQYRPEHKQRLQIKPGITGLWQLSGDRAFLIHENIEYDLYYIQNRNFFMDLAILLHTLVFAMRGV